MIKYKAHIEDFEVLAKVGTGGFGNVFKVRHRLDDRLYALKQVRVRGGLRGSDKDEVLKLLKEARTLSSLDHCNILRYYGCWLHQPPSMSACDGKALAVVEKKPPRKISSFVLAPSEAGGSPRGCGRAQGDRKGPHSPPPESREIEYPLDSMESEKERCDWKEGDEPSRSLASDLDSPSNGGHTGEEETNLLYIQTEICDFNLEEYLELRSLLVRRAVRQCEDGRLYRKHDMEIFPNLFYEGFAITLQMLAALRYIHHTHKLIHRDLKPSNIFMIKKNSYLQLKLGDFGLVKKLRNATPQYPFAAYDIHEGYNCPEQDCREGNCALVDGNKNHQSEQTDSREELGKDTGGKQEPTDRLSYLKNSFKLNRSVLSLFTRSVGTRLYASPEQLKEATYGQPSDIYSLGIVLVRILTPTFTQMETVMLIEKLRQGELRDSFKDYFPLLHALILQMLSLQPSERPSLDKIEQVIVEEEIRIFRDLFQNYDPQVREIFGSAENTLNICQFSNILRAQISNELEPTHKECLLIIRNDEILVFYDHEKKSRLTLYISEYSLIVHKKQKIVCLSNHLKVDQRLGFKWEGDMYCLVKYAEDQRCSVY